MFVALLAVLFSVAITIQSYPIAEFGDTLTVSSKNAADIEWSKPGKQDAKDDCGASLHCHHGFAILPVAVFVGAKLVEDPNLLAIEPHLSWLSNILAPPPKSV